MNAKLVYDVYMYDYYVVLSQEVNTMRVLQYFPSVEDPNIRNFFLDVSCGHDW